MEITTIDKKPIVVFSIADQINMPYFEKMKASLHHFHPDIPVELISGDLLKNTLTRDPYFYYRATPVIGSQLLKKYKKVIKIDSDSIITSSLDYILNDDDEFDVGTVFNDTPLSVWDIQTYYNCGLVVMQNESFVDHWHRLCYSPHFDHYQYREQDLLSIITSDYFNYKVKCYDLDDKVSGIVAKPEWPQAYMKKGEIYIKTKQGEKPLAVIHFGGGNSDPSKGNYKIRFKPDVVEYIDSLIK